MNIIYPEAQMITKYLSSADIGSDHAFFNDAIGTTALFDNDFQYISFLTQHKVVVMAIFENQCILMTLTAACIADTF